MGNQIIIEVIDPLQRVPYTLHRASPQISALRCQAGFELNRVIVTAANGCLRA